KRPIWALLIIAVFLLLSVPLLYIPGAAVVRGQENWAHVLKFLLPRYLWQTLILGLGTAFGSGLLGISSAWIMSRYTFRGKMFFEILLYLPLAVPAYIMAYAYAGFFETGGILSRVASSLFSVSLPAIPFMNMGGLIVVMSLALYPYVYATVRSSFQLQPRSSIEAARILGASPRRAFWSVALPSARPAIVAGISLVLMETFSEYGAVQYYGVENFTTGIFRAWFTLRDTSLALKLAGLLLLFTFGSLAVEKHSRGRKSYHGSSAGTGTAPLVKLAGWPLAGRVGLLLFPVLFGFVIPVALYIYWSSGSALVFGGEFRRVFINTVAVGSVASLLIIVCALLLNHASMLFSRTYLQTLTRLSNLGYAIPGAVLSLALLMFSNGFLHLLRDSGLVSLEAARTLLVQMGFVNLLFAFVLRYLAVAYKPLESHYLRVGGEVAEASLSLGKSPFATLLQVNLPLLRIPLLTGGLLVFIDLVKELPMTLILRPFNFETLAVKAYYHATNEMIASAAPYSLTLVAIAAIPSIVLAVTRMKRRKRAL
ncbi:MAG: ABC transporter permease, partial [Spirochaetota bacterium]